MNCESDGIDFKDCMRVCVCVYRWYCSFQLVKILLCIYLLSETGSKLNGGLGEKGIKIMHPKFKMEAKNSPVRVLVLNFYNT